MGSHAAKMTGQGEHGNSGNLLKGRRGVRPAAGRGTANPPQAPRQADTLAQPLRDIGQSLPFKTYLPRSGSVAGGNRCKRLN